MTRVIVRSLEEWRHRFGDAPRTVLTIGNFDGLHLGHQAILRRVVERARALGCVSAAVTFDPHPLKVLRPSEAPPLVATLEQRLAGLQETRLDVVLVLAFDLALARLSPKDFVRGILVEQLRMGVICVGENFRFGHQQAGDVELVAALGRQLGFDLETVPSVAIRGEAVSSTAIRRAVGEGRMGHAARMLGHPFLLSGEIEPGAGVGERLVVPTLNLAYRQELLPAKGVYATETLFPAGLGGRRHASVTNVGVRPTFDGSRLTVESHLLDFSETLVGGPMEVHFWKRLRDEQKFSGPDALRAQIGHDLARTRSFFRRLDHARATRQPR